MYTDLNDKDRKLEKPDLDQDAQNRNPSEETGSAENAAAKKERSDKKKFPAEHLPVGTGYLAEELPVDVIIPEVIKTEPVLPDPVREAEIFEVTNDPVPSPEDEYYDFEKDIYGDEPGFRP